MPTENEQWKVESVVQYRCQYGTEQWLVKWKDYGEDRNTWEPWEHPWVPRCRQRRDECEQQLCLVTRRGWPSWCGGDAEGGTRGAWTGYFRQQGSTS